MALPFLALQSVLAKLLLFFYRIDRGNSTSPRCERFTLNSVSRLHFLPPLLFFVVTPAPNCRAVSPFLRNLMCRRSCFFCRIPRRRAPYRHSRSSLSSLSFLAELRIGTLVPRRAPYRHSRSSPSSIVLALSFLAELRIGTLVPSPAPYRHSRS